LAPLSTSVPASRHPYLSPVCAAFDVGQRPGLSQQLVLSRLELGKRAAAARAAAASCENEPGVRLPLQCQLVEPRRLAGPVSRRQSHRALGRPSRRQQAGLAAAAGAGQQPGLAEHEAATQLRQEQFGRAVAGVGRVRRGAFSCRRSQPLAAGTVPTELCHSERGCESLYCRVVAARHTGAPAADADVVAAPCDAGAAAVGPDAGCSVHSAFP